MERVAGCSLREEGGFRLHARKREPGLIDLEIDGIQVGGKIQLLSGYR